MLGKLLKYEFKHTAKIMFATFAALAFATLGGSLAFVNLYWTAGDTKGMGGTAFAIILLFLYVIAIIAVYCGDFIYLCYHYYKTMYSSQGYLTHTLPVSPAATFNAKILVFFIWMAVSSILAGLSGICLVQVGSRGLFWAEVKEAVFSEAFRQDVSDLFGMSFGSFLSFAFLNAVLGILMFIMMIAASMAIGQLFQKGRVGFMILAGFAIYMLNQIVSTIFLVIVGYNTQALLTGDMRTFIPAIMYGSLLLSIAFLAILYAVCVYINRKRLNLE